MYREKQRIYRKMLIGKLFVVMAALLLPISSALMGDHVCYRVENYTVKSQERFVEPVEIHTLSWCLQMPPRCPETRTELRERWRTKMETKFKTVPVCCEGFTVQEIVGKGSAGAKCVPYCKRCKNGACTAPSECTCDPGYQGQDCASECPQGYYGKNCENECNCLREVACNPINGKCECPAGWMGLRCENKCPEGQWGAGCNSICLCENSLARCHHESGECIEPSDIDNAAPIDPFEASGLAANMVPAVVVTAKSSAAIAAGLPAGDYIDVIDYDKEVILSRVTEQELETAAVPSLPDEMIPVQQRSKPIIITTTTTLERKEEEQEQRPVIIRRPMTSPLPQVIISTTEGNQLSQPEDNDKPRKPSFDFDERQTNFRVIVSPKTDYIKTTHKGGAGTTVSSIPIDVAAMIVVGALISIGLTSVAALMIFHVRSRLLKAALSIYNQEKVERQFVEKDNISGKGLDVTIGTLPRTMTRVNPVYNAGSDVGSAVLTFDERPNDYANGTVTIGIRLSSNLRDLLESHYDRPATSLQQQQQQQQQQQSTATLAAAETDVEHVYDEIPLSVPFYFAKDT